MNATKLRFSLFFGLALTIVGIPVQSLAQELDISDSPLFVAVSIGPNVMFTTDDSGSMAFDYMPDHALSRQFLGLPDDPGTEEERGDMVAYLWPYPEIGASGGFSRVYDNRTVPTFKNDIVNAYYRSPSFNSIYYDPTVDYEPWVESDGTQMDDADPSNAYFDPKDTGDGSINLKTEKTDISALYSFEDQNPNDDPGGDPSNPPVDVDCDPTEEGADSPDLDDCIATTESFWPMVYWIYDGSGSEWDLSSYTKIEIRNGTVYIDDVISTAAAMNLITGMDRTVEEEEQNFANWFQYYRARVLVSRAGIGKAFLALNDSARVGFARINKGGTTIDGEDNTHSIVSGVRDFDSAGRTSFYDSLYTAPVGGGTPLRSAAIDVGEYFERSDDQGPWSETPGVATPEGEDPEQLLACRQSYHILLTDGYYSGESIDVGNSDNSNGTAITAPDGSSYTYTPESPFMDDTSNTLADIAMEYWKRDLLPDVDNRVPTNEVDSAFWQHLTSFGVGFGVDTDQVDPEAAFAAIESGAQIDWPDIDFGDREDPAKIDDLLHFAVNGRGGFFSAANPDEFASELAAILSEVISRANATTSVAVSATRLSTATLVYAASFDSEDWSGELLALNAEDGSIEHRATDELEQLGADGRSIFSYDPDADSGIAFEANGATAGAIGDRLMANAPTGGSWTAQNLIAYIRGNDSPDAGNPEAFRQREVMLGDIVNSRPFYSGSGNEGWGRVDEDYLDYIDGHKNDPDRCDEVEGTCNYAREDTLFIGANDGMLHAFDAETLEEFFAYVPATVHGRLHHLAETDYSHKFFVDGQVAVADAEIGNETGGWGTFLVGTLGAGGRGVYALDITDPESFDEGDVLWEFTAEDDPDLGYTFGEPIITRIGTEDTGTWVAIFGNGYNSAAGNPILYVLNLANGELIEKVTLDDTGTVDTPAGNGLSGLVGWRDPATRTHLSRVYAGDLNGTMWRIDFDGQTPSVVYDDGLFTDPDGRAVTSTPNIAAHPNGGLMVYFGTGKLIEASDRMETQMDRFYAIRDQGSEVSNNFNGSGALAEVEISVASPDGDLPPMRILESSGVSETGWFMNLAVGDTSDGERTLAKARVIFGTVIISTYQPVEDPCTPGGIQRTYVMDALSGDGALPYCSNCGGIEVGAGAPFSPPVAIKQRPPGSVGDVTFPGNDDPSDPTDPGDFPGAPPADGGDRQGWCSEFGIPPLFEGGSFLSLGTICEGRQAWREVQ